MPARFFTAFRGAARLAADFAAGLRRAVFFDAADFRFAFGFRRRVAFVPLFFAAFFGALFGAFFGALFGAGFEARALVFLFFLAMAGVYIRRDGCT